MPQRPKPRVPPPTLASQALVALLVAAGTLMVELETACAAHGITHDQYNVLRILRGVHPAGHARSEVAARLIRRAPDVTRMLDRLERQSLLVRGWDPENRRRSIATITGTGLTLLARIDPALTRVQAAFTAGCAKADLVELRRLCRGLVASA